MVINWNESFEEFGKEEIFFKLKSTLSENAFKLLRNLSVINTDLASNINMIIFEIVSQFSNYSEIFRELSEIGILINKEEENEIFSFSNKKVQDILKQESKLGNNIIAVDYYQKKIEKFEESLEDTIEILYHQLKIQVNEELLNNLIELENKLSSPSYNYTRLIQIANELKRSTQKNDKLTLIELLGHMYESFNKYEDAERNYKDGIKYYEDITKKEPNEIMPKIISIHINLGNLYRKLKNYEQAEITYKKAMELNNLKDIDNKLYKYYDAIAKKNLGQLYGFLRENKLAYDLYQKSLRTLEDLEKEFPGEFQYEIARVYDRFGILYPWIGKTNNAENAFKRSLEIKIEIDKKGIRNIKSSIAWTKVNLANLYRKLKRYYEAELWYIDTLRMNRELAKTNPDEFKPKIASTLNNIGAFYKERKQYERCEAAYLEALNINLEMADKYPETYSYYVGRTQKNLGDLYRESNKAEKAIEAYSNTLEIYNDLLKNNLNRILPEIIAVENVLGNLFYRLKDYDKTESCYLRNLQHYETISELKGSLFLLDVAILQNRLGKVYISLRKYSKSITYFNSALEIYGNLANERPDLYLINVATIQRDLGKMYLNLYDYTTAEKSFLNSLNNYYKLMERDPTKYIVTVSTIQKNLGKVYLYLKKIRSAEIYFNKALKNLELLKDEKSNEYFINRVKIETVIAEFYLELKRYEYTEIYYNNAYNDYVCLYDNNKDIYKEPESLLLYLNNNLEEVFSKLFIYFFSIDSDKQIVKSESYSKTLQVELEILAKKIILESIKEDVEIAQYLNELELLIKDFRNDIKSQFNELIPIIIYFINKIKIPDEINVFFNKVAELFANMGLYNETIFFYKMAISICSGIEVLHRSIKLNFIARFNKIIGNQYFKNQNYKTGLRYFYISLEIYLKLKMDKKYKDIENIIEQEAIIWYKKNNKYERLGKIFRKLGKIQIKTHNLEDAIKFYNKSMLYYKKIKRKESIGDIYLDLGKVYGELGNFKKAISNFEKSLKIFEELTNSKKIISCFTKFRDLFSLNQKHEIGINYFERLIKKRYSEDNNLIIGQLHKRIADLYSNQNLNDLSIDFYKKAINNFKKGKIWNEYIATTIKLGNLYYRLKVFNAAIECYIRARECNKELQDWGGYSFLNTKIAGVFARQNNLTESIARYKKSLKYYSSINNIPKIIHINRKLAEIFLQKNKIVKTLKYYKIIIRFLNLIGDFQQATIYIIRVGNCYEQINKFSKGIQYFEKSIDFYRRLDKPRAALNLIDGIGKLFIQKESYNNALTYYKEAIRISETIEDFGEFTRFTNKIGEIFLKKEDFEKAIKRFEELLEIYLKINNKKEVAWMNAKIGECNAKLENYEIALKYYNNAIKYHEELGNFPEVARNYTKIGDLFYYRYLIESALNYYEKALNIDSESENIGGMALLNLKIGNSYARKKDYTKAFEHFETAIKLNEEIESLSGIAKTNMKKGDLYSLQGDYENALKSYKEAVKCDIINENKSGIAQCSIKIAELYSKQGKDEKMLKYYEIALNFDKKNYNLARIAHTLTSIGNSYFSRGKFQTAIKYYEDALKNDITNRNWNKVAQSNIKIGKVYLRLDEFETALKYFLKSIEMDKKNKQWHNVIRTSYMLGSEFLRRENYEKAIEFFQQTLDISINRENWSEAAHSTLKIGDIYTREREFDIALNYYEQALEYDKRTYKNKHIAKTYARIGALYESKGDLNKSLEYLNKTLETNKKYNDTLGIAFSYRRVGDILFKLGEIERAVECFEKAIKLLVECKDLERVAQTYTVLGNEYLNREIYEDALKNYENALKYDELNQNRSGIALSYNKIGNVYNQQKKYDDALKYYDQALEYLIEIKDFTHIVGTLIIIASIHRNKRDWPNAYRIYDELSNQLKAVNTKKYLYFKIQALRCQVRELENQGSIKEAAEICKEISKKYRQMNHFWFSIYYNLMHSIFQAELLSQEGEHDNCLTNLQVLEVRIQILSTDREKETKGFFDKLLEFREKQVNFLMTREKAYILEEDGDFSKSSDFYKQCANKTKELVSPRFKLDYLLYEGISKYYLGHSKRLEYQQIFHQMDIESQKRFLINNVKPNFIKAKEIFEELNQKLRLRDISYEILLIDGRLAELGNKKDELYEICSKAKELLLKIDENKVSLFNMVFTQLKDGRRVTFEKFYLHRGPPGEEFVVFCDLTTFELKRRFINITIDDRDVLGYLGDEYLVIVKIDVDENYFEHFERDYYIIQFNDIEQKFYTETNLTTIFKFILSKVHSEGKKIFQFKLYDKYKTEIRTKELIVNYKQKTIEKREEGLASVIRTNLGENPSKKLHNLIKSENFDIIEDIIDKLVSKASKFEDKLYYHILKDFTSNFKDNYLEFDFVNAKRQYIRTKNKIDISLELFTQKEKENFWRKIRSDILNKFIKEIENFLQKTKKDRKIENTHPFIFEIYEYKINNAFRNKKNAIGLQYFIAFFEKLMNKILDENHKLDSNKINWNDFDNKFIEKYKELLAHEIGKSKESIILKDKLEFESAKCLLIVLKDEISEFYNKNSIIINKVRKARNESPLEHGIKPIDENTANLCLELLEDIKNYPKVYQSTTTLLDEQLRFFKDYLEFINKEKSIVPLEPKPEKKIPESKEEFEINNIKLFRGGDWIIEGNRSVFIYKIKILNQNPYVISNIKILLDDPPPGLELASEQLYKIGNLDPGAYDSPPFKFLATSNCVGNKITGIITFKDPKGEIQTINIKPLEIKYVCNLLVPKEISEEEFEQKIKLMESNQIIIKSDFNTEELKAIIEEKVKECNFALVKQIKEIQHNEFRGFARGLYDKQEVALKIILEKQKEGNNLVIKAMSKENAKTIDILKDLKNEFDPIKNYLQLVEDYSPIIENIMEEIHDLEDYLIHHIGTTWEKLEETIKEYKEGKINKKELIKRGIKALGRRFIRVFVVFKYIT